MIHLDSSFLIDLIREHASERPGPALDLIESFDESEELGVSVFVLSELRLGAELARRPVQEHERLDLFLAGLLVAYPDDRFPQAYARLLASVAHDSKRPAAATMDLLIATSALLDDAPLVTRHAKDFSRVPGLRVLKY